MLLFHPKTERIDKIQLQNITGLIAITTVGKSLKGLEDKGLITRQKHYDISGKGQLSNIYTLLKL